MKNAAVLFCVAAAVACTKSSISYEAPDQEISIRPVTRVSLTKAAAVTDGKMPLGNDLKIYAYFDENQTSAPVAGVGNNYQTAYFGVSGVVFTAKDKTEASSDRTWAGKGQTYYWPRTGSMLFAGYAPATFDNGTISYSPSTNSFTLAGPYVQPALDATVDLLYSPYSSAASCESHQAVEMEFKHALAWITFKVKTDETAADVYRITGLKVNKLANKASEATFSITGAEWTLVNDSDVDKYKDVAFYEKAAAASPISVVSNEIEIADEDKKDAGLVIPVTLSDEELVVNYEMKVAVTGAYVSQTFTQKLKDLGGIDKWESGKHYTYVINFGALNPIEVKPTVDQWTESSVTVPVSGESGSASGTGE